MLDVFALLLFPKIFRHNYRKPNIYITGGRKRERRVSVYLSSERLEGLIVSEYFD